jgi:hypothetical protein
LPRGDQTGALGPNFAIHGSRLMRVLAVTQLGFTPPGEIQQRLAEVPSAKKPAIARS